MDDSDHVGDDHLDGGCLVCHAHLLTRTSSQGWRPVGPWDATQGGRSEVHEAFTRTRGPYPDTFFLMRRIRLENGTPALSRCLVWAPAGALGADRRILEFWLHYDVGVDTRTGEIHRSIYDEKVDWFYRVSRRALPGVFDYVEASGLGPGSPPETWPRLADPDWFSETAQLREIWRQVISIGPSHSVLCGKGA